LYAEIAAVMGIEVGSVGSAAVREVSPAQLARAISAEFPRG
jgi:hypothetical protein